MPTTQQIGKYHVKPGQALIQKYNILPMNRVLDISDMDVYTLKGIRTVIGPRTNRRGKFSTHY